METDTSLPRSQFVMAPGSFEAVYDAATLASIQSMTRNSGQCLSAAAFREEAAAFEDLELLFMAWGAPRLEAELLEVLPNLKAVFYAAGSVKGIVSEAFWERGITLTSGYQANAIPVADFTLAAILFALKNSWRFQRDVRAGKVHNRNGLTVPGIYRGSRIGIIALGAIGRLVCERLRDFEVDVMAYDPVAEASLFDRLGVERADSLETIFAGCDVVSLHAPVLPQTRGMITAEHFRMLPEHATFINTARAALIDEPGLIEVLKARPDLYAVLDVLQDESDFSACPLVHLENAFVTPHISGSIGREFFRLGARSAEECRRFLAGEPQLTPIDRDLAAQLA